LIGDPGRLRQIIVNLLGNAIKFTERGEVVLGVELLAADSNHCTVHITVADTGVGIPPDEQTAVFDSFAQADASTTRKFGGTGLGLSIASQLTQLMGGWIWVESQLGVGSTFHVSISFELAPGEGLPVLSDIADEALSQLARGAAIADRDANDISPAVTESTRREDSSHLRVLLAEDNAVNALLASVLLKKHGHDVTHVVNGRQALDAMTLHEFDLVLMDGQMPVMDGLAATAEIRRAETRTGRHIAIVALTAHAMSDDRKRFLDAGADGYLSKPFSPEQLYSVIEGLRSLTDEQTLPKAS
jgi:CheY-like chemotaxis protein